MKPFLAVLSTVLFASACAAEIGDECTYDVDCSPNMDRYCDRSQPGGYCLIIGCKEGECPSESVCVEFTTPCPEGTPDDYCRLIEPNRGRTYCLEHCTTDGDCRGAYFCADPADLSAAVIDFAQYDDKVCVPEPDV